MSDGVPSGEGDRAQAGLQARYGDLSAFALLNAVAASAENAGAGDTGGPGRVAGPAGLPGESGTAGDGLAASTGPPPDGEQILAALVVLRSLRAQLSDLEPRLIASARALGTSWASLAPALGVASRQAAERRYLRLRPDADHPTGEARVRAERDRRAGDRAVTAWAADHAATLRALAAQISTLPNLAPAAQHHADALHDALATPHPGDLLTPLDEAAPHLRPDHPALAARIDAVSAQTTQIRRDSHNRLG
ncbi:HSP18 transcriptional regulator [Actinokineospora guangxiensis]|uniref:HSP18 transcriptional regulator n=1 Tax=Actinokineospora guangxiensis TaxID=1490288 RepID=A0ABW0EXM7_9PSEU